MEKINNDKPVISVIIPVYNAEATLRRCVDSVLAQSLNSFEAILIDDGSTDGSGKICDEYAASESRIKVIHQPRGGVSSARNAGLKLAQGEWLAFCDSDDSVCDYWLSSLYAATQGSDMVVCGYNWLRLEKPDTHPVQKTLGHCERFTEIDVMLETLIANRLFQNIWNKLFNRDVVSRNSISFQEAFNVFEDEYFVLDYLSKVSTVVCIPECSYNYFSPADYLKKYDCGIDAFQEVVARIFEALAYVSGRIKLPSMVKWYEKALIRYSAAHTYPEMKDRILFAKKLADNFYDGPLSHISFRILPAWAIYPLLKMKSKKEQEL